MNILKHKKSITLIKQDTYFEKQVDKYYEPYVKRALEYWKNFFFARELPQIVLKLGNVIIITFAVFSFKNNEISMGTLIYVQTINSILMGQISNLLDRFLRRIANNESFRRFDSFQLLPENTKVRCDEIKEKGIHIENVDVEMNQKFLYHIHQFKIEKPGLVMIEGPNGSGKSTLMNWMLGIAPPDYVKKGTAGIIQLQDNLFMATSYLSSPNVILEESVKDNILLGRSYSPKFNNLVNALDINFLDKDVTVNPVNLSFGEQQKIFLARVLYEESEFIILDEPLVNMDVISKQHIQDYLMELKKDKMIIVISHEGDLEKIADQIYQIVDGELIVKAE